MIAAAEGTARAPLGTPIVACRGVSVTYPAGGERIAALDDVSLDVPPRARIGLAGRSGSGKTTLLHVLGGLVEPTAGTVEWLGTPLASLDEVARRRLRRRGIAFVFQTPQLLPYFSAAENVRFVARGHARADADELLELVGLAAKFDHLPAELSGGERQRVAIARALALQPQLLLCDEPTGRLDSDTAGRVLDLLDALQASLDVALVVASHDAGVLGRYDREVRMADGRIVTAGRSS